MSKAILVLHGMTMSGDSMVRSMGTLAESLQDRGFELVAPNGAHKMNAADLDEFLSWVAPVFEKRGRDVKRLFRDGEFWKGEDHFDWFRSKTDGAGDKHYHALERSLGAVARATTGKNIVGVIGFSQGAALGILLAALGAQGDERFPAPEWGIYIAGFTPRLVAPLEPRYPIASDSARLLVLGERDPMFTGGKDHLQKWAQAFEGQREELYLAPKTGHEIPRDAASLSRLMDFIQAHSPGELPE